MTKNPIAKKDELGIYRGTKRCPLGGHSYHYSSQEETLTDIERQEPEENPTLEKGLKKAHSFQSFTVGPLTAKDFKDFGEVKEASADTDSITFNNGDKTITFNLFGDCCSRSEFLGAQELVEAAKGKTISSFTMNPREYYVEDDNEEVVKQTDYLVTFTDGSECTLQDRNYSNDYYSSVTYWTSS